jgi:branched-chain amino acid transport system ATP-binding protein
LQLLELDNVAGVTPATLTIAQQKRVDLARALASAPDVLLVDEIAAGLNPTETGASAKLLQTIKEWGTSLVVVEHIMSFLEQVADRVIVLDAGRVIFSGTLEKAVHDPEVIKVFFGD